MLSRLNKIYAMVLLGALTLLSCKTKQLPVASNITITDKNVTVRERVVWQNVVITVPVERVQQIVKNDTSHLETSIAKSDSWILPDGSLYHSLENKDVGLKDSIPTINTDTIITKDTSEKDVKYIEVEKKLSKSQSFFIVLGKFSVGILLIFMVMIARKFK